MKPQVFIGQNGLTPSVIHAVDETLDNHELIKVKFIDLKEKDQKEAVLDTLEKQTGSKVVGRIGHVAIFYRAQKDPQKRKIIIPSR